MGRRTAFFRTALVSESVTRLLNYFIRGLVVVVPLALTAYVCAVIFETIDSWLGLRIPGAGFLITIALITVIAGRNRVIASATASSSAPW